ncbi:MAG: hypothetical protein NTX72_01200 [Candidatus Uhrbacteria bacterium]|nr:hypothetical protein [Candidatus Uhrbacteria bacterium]
MIPLLVYLVVTFFLNHIVAQVNLSRVAEHPVRKSGFLLDVATFCAVLLRVPFYLFGIVVYSLCCIGTIIAAAADFIPEYTMTLWIYVLADNLGYASYAFRALLVKEFHFLQSFAASSWAITYYDFHLTYDTRVFSFLVSPQKGYRSHSIAPELVARRKINT